MAKTKIKFVMEPNARKKLLQQPGVQGLLNSKAQAVKHRALTGSPQDASYNVDVRRNWAGLYSALIGTHNEVADVANAESNTLLKGLHE